jgi:starch synthase
VTVWLVDAPALYDRDGGPYLDAAGSDWPDNHLRFGLLGRVAAQLMHLGPGLSWTPELIHCHDWQAGLCPAYLAWWGVPSARTLFTIHNLHFHGRFDPGALGAVGLPAASYAVDGVELYGAASFLKAGLFYADRLTTVSPTYAAQIQTPAGGEGLHGLLQARSADLTGILNGIDDALWDPGRDPHLPARYGAEALSGKATTKAALQAELGLPVDAAAPLVGSVGRLTAQKGIDLLLGAAPTLLEGGGQLAVLGSGDPPLHHALTYAASANPERIAFVEGYNEALSHRLVAGSDALVVPSRFEPCGLTQMYALRYGTVPIVRATGGLADTVIDDDATGGNGTGFCFAKPTSQDLALALAGALAAFANPARWRALQRRGMALDFGWSSSARDYRALYDQVLAEPAHASV